MSRHIGIPLAGMLILSLAASAHADFRGRGRGTNAVFLILLERGNEVRHRRGLS